MKHKSKMKLKDLKVSSFVTQINNNNDLKGGVWTTDCSYPSEFLGCDDSNGPDDEVSIIKPSGGGGDGIASQVQGRIC